MLRSLFLRDFVIVAQAQIDFSAGFSVFSGETGAGKSILIDALSLCLGARGDSGVIRQGAERTEIIATFTISSDISTWLQAHDFEVDEELQLRRIIDQQGRSRAYINGSPTTITQLREVGAMLVDIHGQHAHQSLMQPQQHYFILDSQGQHLELSQQVATAWQQWRQAEQALNTAQQSANATTQELELLEWQIQQLTELDLGPGDWEQLTQEHHVLAHAQNLLDSAGQSLHLLENENGGAMQALHYALQRLQNVLDLDPRLQNIYQSLESAHIACSESISDLNSYLSNVELDPERLAHLDQRMAAAFNLARKHHVEPEDLPLVLQQLQQRQEQLHQAVDLEALQSKVIDAEKQYQLSAAKLSAARLQAAERLSSQVTAAMQRLSMQGGQFVVQLTPTPASSDGNEKVEFLVSGHAGVKPSSLSKVASGGELSRISLAIAVIASQAARVPTLIFDEVDSGISGAVAEIVGQLLHELGERHQVLCVTHLPQVAAFGDTHFQVSKHTDTDCQTVSKIQRLNSEERVEEISRLLGGIHITSTTRQHAKEMLGVQ